MQLEDQAVLKFFAGILCVLGFAYFNHEFTMRELAREEVECKTRCHKKHKEANFITHENILGFRKKYSECECV